jgi:hypothetical protein
MTLKTERRTQLRKRPLSLVYVELPPSNGGMMRDLSEHGFSLRAMMPLRQSEKIPFFFALDTSARIDGEAIVLRVDDGGHVAALEFAGLPPHSRDQIRSWLDKFDEPISPESASAEPMPTKHATLTQLRTQIRAPKPPSPVPPIAEGAPAPPPPPDVAALPRSEFPPVPVPATVETTPPPPPMVVTPPEPEAPLPSLVESQQPPPRQPAMALPRPSSPPAKEEPAPPPPTFQPTIEPVEAPPLPPLLRLSSVRPGPPPAEIPAEAVAQVTNSKPVAEPPAKIQISLPKPEPPAATETGIAKPPAAPPLATRRVPPPALEPLSSFEAETDSNTPGWMDRFTLGRAIGIMLFLMLLAGSYVYHREVGQALIWLGHEIAGEDSSEGSKVVHQPAVPSAAHAAPESSPSARALPPPPLIVQQSPGSNEPRGANLPPASDKTPSPQLKGGTPGSLVPLNQVTRTPSASPPADNPIETGQQEYLQALQILRSPSRASEIPAAVRLLWAAVVKGNTGAEIDLAELFRTGKGVAKNCDQTRILLSAAARKGNEEARKRLEALRREGCGN